MVHDTHIATRVRNQIAAESSGSVASWMPAADASYYAAILTGPTERGGVLDRSALQEESLTAVLLDSCWKLYLPLGLGLVLLLFGIKATRLVHGICGTVSCLFLASLLFHGSALRNSVFGFCGVVGSVMGVAILPKYPDMVGGCVGLMIAEIMGQFIGFYTAGTQYILVDLIGFMLGSLASRYLFKDDAVQSLFSCSLGSFLVIGSAHDAAQRSINPGGHESVQFFDGFLFTPKRYRDTCGAFYTIWVAVAWLYCIYQGIQAHQVLSKERREREDQKKWEASLFNLSNAPPAPTVYGRTTEQRGGSFVHGGVGGQNGVGRG